MNIRRFAANCLINAAIMYLLEDTLGIWRCIGIMFCTSILLVLWTNDRAARKQ
jgi:hypothetical protein